MSAIQEALKRAQKEREYRVNEGFGPGPLSGGPGPRRSRFPFVVAGVAVALAVGVWFMRGTFSKSPEPPPAVVADASRAPAVEKAPARPPIPLAKTKPDGAPVDRRLATAPPPSTGAETAPKPAKRGGDSRDSRLRPRDPKAFKAGKSPGTPGKTGGEPPEVSRVILPAAGGPEPQAEPPALATEKAAPESPPAVAPVKGPEPAAAANPSPAPEKAGEPPAERAYPLSGPEMRRLVDQMYEKARKAQLAGDGERARELYGQAIKISGGHAASENNLGVMDMEAGNLDEAVKRFSESARLSGNFVDPVYNLACVSARQGDREKALETLARAVAMDPAAAEWALKDPDLSALKDMEGFSRIVGKGTP